MKTYREILLEIISKHETVSFLTISTRNRICYEMSKQLYSEFAPHFNNIDESDISVQATEFNLDSSEATFIASIAGCDIEEDFKFTIDLNMIDATFPKMAAWMRKRDSKYYLNSKELCTTVSKYDEFAARYISKIPDELL